MLSEGYPKVQRTSARSAFRQVWAQISLLAQQLHRISGRLLLSSIVVGLAVGIVLLISALRAVPFTVLVRDVFAVAEQPVYIGFLSNLGILLWGSAATIWALCVFALRNTAQRTRLTTVCRWSLALTLVLLVDDALMLHESVLPRLLGTSELVITLALALFGLIYLWRCGPSCCKNRLRARDSGWCVYRCITFERSGTALRRVTNLDRG